MVKQINMLIKFPTSIAEGLIKALDKRDPLTVTKVTYRSDVGSELSIFLFTKTKTLPDDLVKNIVVSPVVSTYEYRDDATAFICGVFRDGRGGFIDMFGSIDADDMDVIARGAVKRAQVYACANPSVYKNGDDEGVLCKEYDTFTMNVYEDEKELENYKKHYERVKGKSGNTAWYALYSLCKVSPCLMNHLVEMNKALI